jgi:ATP-dependent DNA helicase RecQ
MTIPVQKLLSCIIRTKERFGSSYVIDVLLGSRAKRILENEHNFLSTWGSGRELSKDDWFNLVEVLIQEHILIKSGDYNILTITPKGYDLLSSREKVELSFVPSLKDAALNKTSLAVAESLTYGENKPALAFPKPQKKSSYIVGKRTESIVAEKPAADDPQAEIIISKLKEWRKKKASDMNVPPYIIFGDKTLYDIAAKKPASKSELMKIYGLGSVKVENFGNSILALMD